MSVATGPAPPMACRRCLPLETVAALLPTPENWLQGGRDWVRVPAFTRGLEGPPLSEEEAMNKQMLMGLVAGVGVATAGGVLGYQFLGERKADTAVETEEAAAAASAAPASHPASATRTAAAPAQECWDEEFSDTAAPKDEHRVAGTAIGAVVGGAIGKEIGDGDSDLATAAGAAAGAFIGRKAQGEFQENREGTRTTTHTERRCGPAGSAPR